MALRRTTKKKDPKARPEGARYRNLTMRGGTIYFERIADGRRWKLSTKTSDWNEAASTRDLYEQAKGIGSGVPFLPATESPTFAAFARRYLTEDVAHLASTTRRDRTLYLKPEGRIIGYLGDVRLPDVSPALLREWWGAEVIGRKGPQGKPLTVATGRCYLDAIAGVLAYAVDLGILAESPAMAFRQSLRRRARTQRGRADADPSRSARPIEDAAALARLVREARAEGPAAAAFVLLLLDGGLRVGEAIGLRWGCIAWGDGDADTGRHLMVDRSRPRGGDLGPTKSGRARRVACSRRLRDALAAMYETQDTPAADTLVLAGLDDRNFYHRGWRRICGRAGVGPRALKDLRDTYASWLLTSGVSIGYISRQLGHAGVAVTSRHYARWAGGEDYREPLALAPGEVPADLLARIQERVSHQTPTISGTAEDGVSANPRPLKENLEHETGFEPATLTLAT